MLNHSQPLPSSTKDAAFWRELAALMLDFLLRHIAAAKITSFARR
jgi:hypothetical protein